MHAFVRFEFLPYIFFLISGVIVVAGARGSDRLGMSMIRCSSLRRSDWPRPSNRRRSLAVAAILRLVVVLLTAGTGNTALAHSSQTLWPGGRWEPGPARYGVMIQQNVTIPMSDGVLLDATIGYPTDLKTGARERGRFPVILTESPYQAIGTTSAVNQYFVQHGYIFVEVTPRGTQASGGLFDYWGAQDAQDGVAIVDWVAHQLDGSNGVIGLYGCSYSGVLAIAAAEALGPDSGVKAMVTQCPVSDMYQDLIPGGIPGPSISSLSFIPLITGAHPDAIAFVAALQSEINAGGPRAFAGHPHWRARDRIPKAGNIVKNNIATLIWEGWDSSGPRSDLNLYTALQNAHRHKSVFGPMSPNQPASGKYQIVMGPWGHGVGLDDGISLEWFDTFLKRVNTNIDKTDTPMHLYERGTNRWINTAQYPIASKDKRMYLNAGGALTKSKPSGPGSDQILWADATTPGASLTFQTAPFAAGGTIAGPISASLYASSTNTNLQLMVTLADIAPDGTETTFVNGGVIGSLRDVDKNRSWFDANGVNVQPHLSLSANAYLKPGVVYRFDFSLFPRLQSILPGHSLRATISSKLPASQCGPTSYNSGCVHTVPQIQTLSGGTYSLQRSGQYPSALNLPILPYRALPTAASVVTPTSGGFSVPIDWDSRSHSDHHHHGDD